VGALIDPGFDEGNLLRGERAVQRHRRLLEASDPAIQSALIRFARDNRRAAVAALQRAVARPQIEPGCLKLAMAGPAATLQDRLNVSGE